MRRLTGFTLFCMALGMLVALFIDNTVCLVILIGALFIIGYELFCCK